MYFGKSHRDRNAKETAEWHLRSKLTRNRGPEDPRPNNRQNLKRLNGVHEPPPDYRSELTCARNLAGFFFFLAGKKNPHHCVTVSSSLVWPPVRRHCYQVRGAVTLSGLVWTQSLLESLSRTEKVQCQRQPRGSSPSC